MLLERTLQHFQSFSPIILQVFINFLPRYLGVLRPQPEEPTEEEPKENVPLGCLHQGLRPGGEYFIRKINPELVMPWRGR